MNATTTNAILHNQSREDLISMVKKLTAQTDALSSRIAAINEISVAILSSLEIDQIYQVIAREAHRLLNFDQCSITLYHQARDEFENITLSGPALARCSHETILNSPVGAAIASGQIELVANHDGRVPFASHKSLLIIPLLQEETILGSINFAAEKRQAFTYDDIGIAHMLALQLSAAIHNARLMDELKRKENELRQRAGELELRNQELDAYNHTIAHDLKTPINGIMLNVDLVRRTLGGDAPEKAVNYLKRIKGYTRSMTDMIDHLLWLSRLIDVEDTVIPVSATRVIGQALERNQHLIDAKKVAVYIESHLPKSLGHPQWVEEIFANLISNAVKYMGEDNPDPRIHIRGCDDDLMVRYEVEDNGIGIANEDKERLFETFERLHVMDVEGHGLGLSIVARIVNKLGGKVGVESAPGKGSTFWFTLPTERMIAAMSKAATHRIR